MYVSDWIREHLFGGGKAPVDAISPSVAKGDTTGKVVPLEDNKVAGFVPIRLKRLKQRAQARRSDAKTGKWMDKR